MVREINEATRVLSLPAARAQPPDVNISVWDLFTVLGFGEAAHVRPSLVCPQLLSTAAPAYRLPVPLPEWQRRLD